MSIAKIKLDETTKLDFGVQITGAEGRPSARFVIDGKDFSVSFPCKETNEGVEVEIHGLANMFTSGEYPVRLEIILENKIYTPLVDKIEFEPSISIKTESKVVVPIKESIKVSKITVKKQVVSEEQTQQNTAAFIIAQALNYKPSINQTPKDIINSALLNSVSMTNEQIEIVQEMLTIAEELNISYNKDLAPVTEVVIGEEEVKSEAIVEEDDDGWSDMMLDELVESVVSIEDLLEAYDAGEVCLVDSETNEIVDDLMEEFSEDGLNEVLSRAERIRAKVRFKRTENKRERKLHIALHKHSDKKTINKRARRMAIKLIKTRISKKPIDKMTIADKERVERIVATRGKLVDRLALKMLQKVRTLEKDRLSSSPASK